MHISLDVGTPVLDRRKNLGDPERYGVVVGWLPGTPWPEGSGLMRKRTSRDYAIHAAVY